MQSSSARRTICGILLFAIGGLGYNFIECCWRGATHWSMFCLGGICFRLIGHIGRVGSRWPKFWRCAACAGTITAAEFLCGCVVNLWWGLRVWDYSRCPGNLLGQICPLYTVLWGLLSLAAMPLYRYLQLQLGQSVHIGQLPHFGLRAVQISRPNTTTR